MKQTFEICEGIIRTYIQPVVCKSPTTKEVSIEDVEVLPNKLTEHGIRNPFLSSAQKHKRPSSTHRYTCTIHAIRTEASRVLLGIVSLFFRFSKRIHYVQHSYIHTFYIHYIQHASFVKFPLSRMYLLPVGFEQLLQDCSSIVLSLYLI